MRLPGHGGHSPLDAFAFDIGPRQLPSVVLAALASLCFGAVLGPEAPLIAIGTSVGALLAGRFGGDPQTMMVVGALAAMGAVFGNPVITMVLLLEVALVGGTRVARPAVLLPCLAGLATGYLLQIGVGDWTGLGTTQLSVPGLPAYAAVRVVDLLLATALAAAMAAVTLLALRLAGRLRDLSRGSPVAVLLASGATVGVVAAAAQAIEGVGPDLVLFSGQGSMSDYLAPMAVGTALVVGAAKFVAFVASIGGGFRGGLIFPVIALSTLVAGQVGAGLDSGAQAALMAAAIGAAAAVGTRMPFTAVLLGALLTAPAGPAVTVFAIIGALVGMLASTLAAPRRPSTGNGSGAV